MNEETAKVFEKFNEGMRHTARRSDDAVLKDVVDHPSYYGGAESPYEAIKVIEAWGLDFCLGNAVKYISRAGKKDPQKEVEDLSKAVWYINHRIEQLKKVNE